MRKLFILVVILGFLVCAGTAITGCSVPHKVNTPSYQGSGSVNVEVYRQSKFLAGGVEMYLVMDGDVVCAMWNGDTCNFATTPEKHKFIVESYSYTGQRETYTFEDGKSYYIEVWSAWHGGELSITEK